MRQAHAKHSWNFFYPKALSFSNRLFYDVGRPLVIFQRNSENMIWLKQIWLKSFTTFQILKWRDTTCHILKQTFHNASDFNSKLLQSVRFWIEKEHCVGFWIKKISTCQVLKKLLAFRKSRFRSFYSVKTTYFTFVSFFWKAWFWIENFITCPNFNWRNYNASDFELKKCNASDFEIKFFRLVTFSIKSFTTCQILGQYFSILISNQVPAHVLFTSVSSM